MAFLNEYVSDEDIKKYNLDELFLRTKPNLKSIPSNYRHHWTVDSEHDSYFRRMSVGREEHANQMTCHFYWKGELHTVIIESAEGSSVNASEKPFKMVWHLIRGGSVKERKAFMAALKEALTAYGVEGVRYQVPNTVVEFIGFE